MKVIPGRRYAHLNLISTFLLAYISHVVYHFEQLSAYVIYVLYIDVACFHDFYVIFWYLFWQCCILVLVVTVLYFGTCCDSVVFWYLFGQCCILVLVLTVLYFGTCSDSVIFWYLFWQCYILVLVLTMLYFGTCSDSVVFWYL